MLPEPKESELELAICQYFFTKRLFFWKQPQAGYYDAGKRCFRKHANPFVINGVSDLIIVHKGRFIGVEIKTTIGRLTNHQNLFEERLRKAGGLYYVARSVSDAENIYKVIQML